MSTEYEELRKKNIADNKRILAEIGLLNPFNPLPKVVKKPTSFKRKRDNDDDESERISKKFIVTSSHGEYGSVNRGSRRRSSRIKGQKAEDIELEQEPEDEVEDDDDREVKKPSKNRPMVYGAIPGVENGCMWETRMLCNYDGVHRPTVAGIHAGPRGAYSIALSGGYEDDIDLGECFTYTGEGGRDLKGTAAKPKNLRTAAQSKDQCLSRGNQALVHSVKSGFPVRVIRGYKLRSPFAPDSGYRYDGLYRVERWWSTVGLAGFLVYKFALKRLPDQPPPPWTLSQDSDAGESQDSGNVSDSQNSTDTQAQSTPTDVEPTESKVCSEATDVEPTEPEICSEATDVEPTEPEICSEATDVEPTEPEICSEATDVEPTEPEICSEATDVEPTEPETCSESNNVETCTEPTKSEICSEATAEESCTEPNEPEICSEPTQIESCTEPNKSEICSQPTHKEPSEPNPQATKAQPLKPSLDLETDIKPVCLGLSPAKSENKELDINDNVRDENTDPNDGPTAITQGDCV